MESVCARCGKRLPVRDEFAGQPAHCPNCGQRYTVPTDTGPASQPQSPVPPGAPAAARNDDGGQWHLQTPDGRIYGPVERSQLDQWVREGRVGHDCYLRSGPQAPWQQAAAVYAVLAGPVPAAGRSDNPFAGGPFARSPSLPNTPQPHVQGFTKPHRGNLVLALGILSWIVTCPVLSVIAWWMGMTDLQEIREGRMDPAGGGLTQAGMVLGMIYSLLWLAMFAVAVFLLLMFAAGLGTAQN